ncbi:MFS transporter [Terricaulis sp.]|uniref:MFS transporter n=1 Tax=Terricaulis sp. TaxID=2768686 RepID=UPI0037832FA6
MTTPVDPVASPAARANLTEWKQGWPVVLGAACGLGTGISLYLLIASIFIQPIVAAFGWSRGDLGIGGMISFITGALCFPVIGRCVDRFGFRPVAIVCALGLSAVYVATALQPGWYGFYLALMVVGGVFGGGTASIVYARPVVATFKHQRGLALGLATAGTAITAIIAPPLLAHVIDDYGWRAGFFALAALTGAIGLPTALALIGRAREAAASAADEVSHISVRDVSLREALRGPRLWLLVTAIVAINLPGSGVLGQLAPLVADRGLSEDEVALVMSVYAVGLLLGRVLTGMALDRLPVSLVGFLTTLTPALGIVMLLTPAPSFALAALAVAMIGMQQGAEVDLFAYVVSHSFGVKNFSSIYGVVIMAGAFSTAVALVTFGKVHDATGSYDIALIIGAVCFCAGALAFLALGRVRAAVVAAPAAD